MGCCALLRFVPKRSDIVFYFNGKCQECDAIKHVLVRATLGFGGNLWSNDILLPINWNRISDRHKGNWRVNRQPEKSFNLSNQNHMPCEHFRKRAVYVGIAGRLSSFMMLHSSNHFSINVRSHAHLSCVWVVYRRENQSNRNKLLCGLRIIIIYTEVYFRYCSSPLLLQIPHMFQI